MTIKIVPPTDKEPKTNSKADGAYAYRQSPSSKNQTDYSQYRNSEFVKRKVPKTPSSKKGY